MECKYNISFQLLSVVYLELNKAGLTIFAFFGVIVNETCKGVRKNTMLLSLSFALSLKSFEKCAFTFAMLTEVMANYN